MSRTETASVTGTSLWLGGQRTFGLAVREAMTGSVVSTTVTLVVAVALFPEASVAVKVTVVVPSGKTAGALLTTVGAASQISVAVGKGTVTGVPSRLVCSTRMGAGTFEITGAVVSTTVTLVVAVAVFPEASVAVKVTVVVPSGKTAGALLTTVGAASQISVAVGNGTVTGVPSRLVCSTRMGAGTFEITGAVVSTTLTEGVAVAVFPEASVAVNVTVVVPSGNTPGALLVTTGVASQVSVAVG